MHSQRMQATKLAPTPLVGGNAPSVVVSRTRAAGEACHPIRLAALKYYWQL